ncbi:hypothetical protein D1BOALGB6SA_7523 [Olavius sp. associated proteobacterium Delta 1]|nr:hypothetical protein D1BOALGB6SA_7523 [Olavius sp. associated proteobacterium Delta 1]
MEYSNYIPTDLGDSGKQDSLFLFSKLCFFIFQFDTGFPDKIRCVYPECTCINWIKTDSCLSGKAAPPLHPYAPAF